MTLSQSVLGFVIEGPTLNVALMAGVLAPLVLLRTIPRMLAWSIFAAMSSLTLAAFALRHVQFTGHRLMVAAHLCAGLALFWTVTSFLMRGTIRNESSSPSNANDLPGHRFCVYAVSNAAAITGGLAAVVILTVLLTIRGNYWILEILHGAPVSPGRAVGFGRDGLAAIAALIAACSVGVGMGYGSRLIAPLMGVLVMGATWATLLMPTYSQSEDGALTRTPIAIFLIVAWSTLVCGFVAAQGVTLKRFKWRAAHTDPDGLLRPATEWFGFRKSVGALSLLIVMLVCYQLVIPTQNGAISDRLAAAITAVCAVAGGVAAFALAGRRWSANFADIGMGLMTLAVAVLATVVVPSNPTELGKRFPMIFNAEMVAFAVATWVWAWLGNVWRQQIGGPHDRYWTTGGRLSLLAQRFATFVAIIALVVATLMVVWPRLRPAPDLDDSFGRVVAAVSAHLLLLWVLLWSRRTTGRSAHGVLAVLTLLSLVGFLMIRSQPHSSQVLRGMPVGHVEHRLDTFDAGASR